MSCVPEFYRRLNVPVDATQHQIRKAYRQLTLSLHPDRNIGREADVQEECQRVTEAYKVLSDLSAKERYDVQHGVNAHERISNVRDIIERRNTQAPSHTDDGKRQRSASTSSITSSASEDEYCPVKAAAPLRTATEEISKPASAPLSTGNLVEGQRLLVTTVSAVLTNQVRTLVLRRTNKSIPWGMRCAVIDVGNMQQMSLTAASGIASCLPCSTSDNIVTVVAIQCEAVGSPEDVVRLTSGKVTLPITLRIPSITQYRIHLKCCGSSPHVGRVLIALFDVSPETLRFCRRTDAQTHAMLEYAMGAEPAASTLHDGSVRNLADCLNGKRLLSIREVVPVEANFGAVVWTQGPLTIVNRAEDYGSFFAELGKLGKKLSNDMIWIELETFE